MLDYYFQKALYSKDISDSQFMNVMRICMGKPHTHQGVDGEDHYASVSKRVKDKFIADNISHLEISDDTVDEEQEVEEIIAAYKPQVSTNQIKDNTRFLKMVKRQANKDNKNLLSLEDSEIESDDSEYDIAL